MTCGFPDEAHRDVEAAAHATRVRDRPPGGRIGQRETMEQTIRDRAWVLEVPQVGDQHEILPPAEDLVDGRELSGEADGLSDVRRLRGDVKSVDASSPRIGLEQRGQDSDERGLACPVRAEQGENVATSDLEVHTAQHLQLLVRLLQPMHVDSGRGGLTSCHSPLSS
jgi:hypothetical protein